MHGNAGSVRRRTQRASSPGRRRCLVSSIPARERVITCEEVFELRLPLADVVAMQTRQPNLDGAGEVRLRRLVKEALRMRPDRIVVGEVRQEEALDLP